MFISKKGTITFIPDFRIKRVHISKLKRVAVNFNEWDNYRYSVAVKLVYKDGRIFTKDYSNQFKNVRKKALFMRMYTLSNKKINNICDKVSRSDLFNISIIDLSGNIIYQNKNDKQSF